MEVAVTLSPGGNHAADTSGGAEQKIIPDKKLLYEESWTIWLRMECALRCFDFECILVPEIRLRAITCRTFLAKDDFADNREAVQHRTKG